MKVWVISIYDNYSKKENTYGVYDSVELANKVVAERKSRSGGNQYTVEQLWLEINDDFSKEFHKKYSKESKPPVIGRNYRVAGALKGDE